MILNGKPLLIRLKYFPFITKHFPLSPNQLYIVSRLPLLRILLHRPCQNGQSTNFDVGIHPTLIELERPVSGWLRMAFWDV